MAQPFDRAWLPIIDHTRCEGCGDCVAACPAGALALVEGRAALIHPADCTYCTACEDLCPNGAIALPFLICRGDAET